MLIRAHSEATSQSRKYNIISLTRAAHVADVRTYERSHFHVSQTARDSAILGILPVLHSFQMTDPPHRQRAWRLCLSCTWQPAALAFSPCFRTCKYTQTIPDACFPSLSLIAFQSPSTRQRYNRFISILSCPIFCLLMVGHQSFLITQLLMQRSRRSESFCPDRAVHLKDKWEGTDEDEDVVDSVNTNRIVYIYPQQQAKLQRDTLKTVGLKLKSTKPK